MTTKFVPYSWIGWVTDYVNEHLPDPSPLDIGDGAIVFDESFASWSHPYIAVCDQCDEPCVLYCRTCGAGLHSHYHSQRHIDDACIGEDHFDWFDETTPV